MEEEEEEEGIRFGMLEASEVCMARRGGKKHGHKNKNKKKKKKSKQKRTDEIKQKREGKNTAN